MPPKKDKNKYTRIKRKPRANTSRQSSKQTIEANTDEIKTTVKRRGRQPKAKVSPVLAIEANTDEIKTTTKRRGRPPKAKVIAVKRKKMAKTSHSETIFSFKEKKAFYECLTDRGFSAVHDINLLTQVLPERSENEIKFLIESYSRKAREINKKRDKDNEESDNAIERQPLEKWYDVIHHAIPNASRKNDVSSLFAEIFEEIAKQYNELEYEIPSSSSSSNNQMRPNFGHIYYYISELLSEKFPQEIDPIDAYTYLKLIEDLKESFTKDSSINKEVAFISEEKWNKRENNSAANYHNSLYRERQRQNEYESRLDATNSSETDNMDDCDNRVSDDKTGIKKQSNVSFNNSDDSQIAGSFIDLPKIRKIVDCLNPIQVPVSLLKDEQIRWQNVE